ncbi:UBX domain-containing protein [Macrophomina phaseolina MS6]|uniref:UBX domain-containing protein 2 n=1 Tax=Macrophomina phaseolina (strain MS6) TaxID=1126212 RepID=K2QNV7_MACPH|nr:UBX domain-containing protein [Macrophomina phaseolina MS6]
MFYEGDLQSGISLAIQQAKLVVCFVRDASEESSTWENGWLRDEPIAPLIAEKTVTLRLDAGSQEAGFLSAFCPIAKTPVIVVIHNGQLKLCLVGGISREDFVSRLSAVLDPESAQQNSLQKDKATVETGAETSQASTASIEEEPTVTLSRAPATQPTTEAPQAEEPQSTSAPPVESPQPTAVHSLFPDRAARLEADHQAAREAEAAEAAARAAKAAGKRKAVDAEIASASSKDPKQLSYAAQEKIRKQAQQSELNRILQRVEADKKERKEREELRKKQREAELREFSGAEFASPSPPAEQLAKRGSVSSPTRGPAAKSGDVCLRIRLLDGSQIREYFPPSATLAADVRPRVDWALSSGPSSSSSKPTPAPPYSFKHILAPLPNRTLGSADENKPLGELPDVVPSATLVLVPAKNAVSAYSGAGGGYVGSIYVAILHIYTLLTTFLGTFFAPFGRGGGGGGGASSSGPGAAVGGQEGGARGGDGQGQGKSSGRGEGVSGSGIRIRTLRDQGDTANEYYNGNSLDFEPKKEEDEDEGK